MAKMNISQLDTLSDFETKHFEDLGIIPTSEEKMPSLNGHMDDYIVSMKSEVDGSKPVSNENPTEDIEEDEEAIGDI